MLAPDLPRCMVVGVGGIPLSQSNSMNHRCVVWLVVGVVALHPTLLGYRGDPGRLKATGIRLPCGPASTWPSSDVTLAPGRTIVNVASERLFVAPEFTRPLLYELVAVRHDSYLSPPSSRSHIAGDALTSAFSRAGRSDLGASKRPQRKPSAYSSSIAAPRTAPGWTPLAVSVMIFSLRIAKLRWPVFGH